VRFTDPPPHAALQQRFLTILPRVEQHARIYFRHLGADRLEEAVAEMTALAWKWHLNLAARGKDVTQFPTVLAAYAARAVRSGRRLCGQAKAKDVMSPAAQQRHGFAVGKLPDVGTLSSNPLEEALVDNTRTPPDEQVAFRLDFPAWLRTHTDRTRRIVGDLMAGERTLDVARKHGLTPGRVSQMRRELLADWQNFTGGPAAA
jgi:hypothetical protein